MLQVYSRAVRGLSTEQNGLVRELQNCGQHAQNDQAVNDRLKERALLVFRTHEQSIGRFFDVVIWLFCFHRYFFFRLHILRSQKGLRSTLDRRCDRACREGQAVVHRDRMLALNSPLPAASRATAACRAIDFRLRLAVWRFDISPPHRVSPVQKCHRPVRCNSPIG
jgi:hypothetical protein